MLLCPLSFLIFTVVQPAPSDEGDLLSRGTIQSRIDSLLTKMLALRSLHWVGKVNLNDSSDPSSQHKVEDIISREGAQNSAMSKHDQ